MAAPGDAAVPADRLAAEREYLHPLPDEPYALPLGEERLAAVVAPAKSTRPSAWRRSPGGPPTATSPRSSRMTAHGLLPGDLMKDDAPIFNKDTEKDLLFFLNEDLWTGDFSGGQYAAARKARR